MAIPIISLPSFLDLAPRRCPAAYSPREPKRGDIIVFKLPSDGQTDYIKRLIGLPGDKIQVQHGRLYHQRRNGAARADRALRDRQSFRQADEAPHYLETLPGGVKHTIIQIDGDEGTFDNTQVYEVPPGHYFMMGDNRDNSSDSRLAGGPGRRRLRAVREPDRPRRNDLLFGRRGRRRRGRSGNGRGRCAGTACSKPSIEARRRPAMSRKALRASRCPLMRVDGRPYPQIGWSMNKQPEPNCGAGVRLGYRFRDPGSLSAR